MNDLKPNPGHGETLDSFYHGRIQVFQKKEGFRFSIDAPLLADFIRIEEADECLELGTGSGIISILLSFKPFKHITALEIQPQMAEISRKNVKLNGLEKRVEVLNQDFRTYSPKGKFDVVFSNPPYIKRGKGHLSQSSEKSIAKHEIECSLTDILDRTTACLKSTGRAYFIYPALRYDEFLETASDRGLHISTLRYVHSYKDQPPSFFLAELKMGTGCFSEEKDACPHFGNTLRAPHFKKPDSLLEPCRLILYNTDGSWSPEARAIFAGRLNGSWEIDCKSYMT